MSSHKVSNDRGHRLSVLRRTPPGLLFHVGACVVLVVTMVVVALYLIER